MRPNRPGALILGIASVIAATLSFASCGDDDATTTTAAATSVTAAATTPASATKTAETSPTAKPSASTTASASASAVATPTLVTSRGTSTKPVEKIVPMSMKQSVVTGAQTQDQNRREAFGFSFNGGIPGYRVEYVKEAVQCGSGAAADMQGAAGILVVTMRPAVAHDDAGKSTVTQGAFLSSGRVIKGIRQICDFEGVVAFAIGLSATDPFEVVELDGKLGIIVGKPN